MLSDRKKVMVTGATGFVGSALLQRISKDGGYTSVAVLRRAEARLPENVESVQIENMDTDIDWRGALAGVDCIVHTAARVHVMRDAVADPLTEFRKVNTDAALHLARQAGETGVRRFIYISSIKVNGESTARGEPFTEDVAVAPSDPYARSKYEAEEGLRALAAVSDIEIVIIRPPLVYGPGVKANFLKMMQWLDRGVPLPLGAIHNKRTLVGVDNLIDLIMVCIEHKAAANQTFLVGDGHDFSTTELLQYMGQALAKPARLIPVPAWILCLVAAMLGQSAVAKRLCGSLQLDVSKAKRLLGWEPPVNFQRGLQKATESYIENKLS